MRWIEEPLSLEHSRAGLGCCAGLNCSRLLGAGGTEHDGFAVDGPIWHLGCAPLLRRARPRVFRGQGEGGVLGGDPKQIGRTRAESQQIVATRPLYCLQYSVLSKSSA
jgi:hypothetical protein